MVRSRIAPFLFLAACVLATGCTDTMLLEPEQSVEDATVERGDILRNGHLMEDATQTRMAGKREAGDMYAFMAYDEYEADGITRRVLDSYGITRRILNEYGITRRVLDSYGITRRVLEEYGITRRILNDYGFTMEVLERHGITRRIMDDYGVSREQLEHELAAFEPVIKVRLLMDDGTPGISSEVDLAYWDVIREELQYDPDLAYLEPDPASAVELPTTGGIIRNTKNYQLTPWGTSRIGGGSPGVNLDGVRVYVLDSGVNPHDLNVVERKDFTQLFEDRDEEFWDDSEFQQSADFDPGTTGNPNDENGHGTHIAGIIGALDNDFGIVGVAPGVAIHSLKVLTADGRTDVTTLVAAIRYVMNAKENAPRSERFVVNLSLGMDIETNEFNILDQTVAEAIELGITVIVSAGNDAANADTYSPAHVPDAITVAAFDMNDEFADFSNFGGVVDIVSPGVDIPSLPHLDAYQRSNALVLQSGTSMAAPHAAGAAALFLAQYPNATPADVQAELTSLAVDDLARVPARTSRARLDVSWANGPAPDFSLSIREAQYDAENHMLVLEGDGPNGTAITIRNEATHFAYGQVAVDRDGKWSAGFFNPEQVPCSILVHTTQTGGEMATMAVDGAPDSCS